MVRTFENMYEEELDFENMYSDFGEAEARRIYWVDYMVQFPKRPSRRKKPSMRVQLYCYLIKIKGKFFKVGKSRDLDRIRKAYDSYLTNPQASGGTLNEIINYFKAFKNLKLIEIRDSSKTKILYQEAKPPVRPPPVRPPLVTPTPPVRPPPKPHIIISPPVRPPVIPPPITPTPPVKPPYKPPIRPPVISPQRKLLERRIAQAKRSIQSYQRRISNLEKELAKL